MELSKHVRDSSNSHRVHLGWPSIGLDSGLSVRDLRRLSNGTSIRDSSVCRSDNGSYRHHACRHWLAAIRYAFPQSKVPVPLHQSDRDPLK